MIRWKCTECSDPVDGEYCHRHPKAALVVARPAATAPDVDAMIGPPSDGAKRPRVVFDKE